MRIGRYGTKQPLAPRGAEELCSIFSLVLPPVLIRGHPLKITGFHICERIGSDEFLPRRANRLIVSYLNTSTSLVFTTKSVNFPLKRVAFTMWLSIQW